MIAFKLVLGLVGKVWACADSGTKVALGTQAVVVIVSNFFK